MTAHETSALPECSKTNRRRPEDVVIPRSRAAPAWGEAGVGVTEPMIEMKRRVRSLRKRRDLKRGGS